MNCPECQDWLQRQLDGEEIAPGDELRDHLVSCEECRCRLTAARRLQGALRLMTPPTPPSGLSFRIVREVLADRRRRHQRNRRMAGLLALAAAVLVFVLVDAFRPTTGPVKPNDTPIVKHSQPRTTILERVADAGSLVEKWTAGPLDRAKEQTRALLPVVDPSLLPPMEPPATFEAPATSLREAREGMTASIEPVAFRARRAVNLFLRELPPLGAGAKPEL